MDSRRRAVRQGIAVMVKGGFGARRRRGIEKAGSGTGIDRERRESGLTEREVRTRQVEAVGAAGRRVFELLCLSWPALSHPGALCSGVRNPVVEGVCRRLV